MIFLQIIILYILVICLITNPGSCDQDPVIHVLSIHDFSNCVTEIFSLVTFHDIIRDSGNVEKDGSPKPLNKWLHSSGKLQHIILVGNGFYSTNSLRKGETNSVISSGGAQSKP